MEPMQMDTTPIPSREEIRHMTLGVMAASEYANARAAAWLAIRRCYDEEMRHRMLYASRHVDVWKAGEARARAYQEQQHAEVVEMLSDAIEWAQILDRHEPSRQGSSEMHVFERNAIEAVDAIEAVK